MATSHLRLYPSEDHVSERPAPSRTITVRLKELYPLLARAYRDDNVWLRDFESDEVRVSSDLYQVIRAFDQCASSA